MSSKKDLYRLVLSGMFLALAIVLPFLTGQIPQIGNALCPMHIPVLLCGFFCGPLYGALTGFIAPLLRYVLFGMPPLIPTGIAMSFELAAYGSVSAVLWHRLPEKRSSIYFALLAAMLSGRIIWGAVRTILYGLGRSPFGWMAFLSGAFLNSVPGIIVQLILIPQLVFALRKYTRR